MLSISLLFLLRFAFTLVSDSFLEPSLIAAFVGLAALSVFIIFGLLRRKTLNAFADKRRDALFNANPLPAWIIDPATENILEVNDAAVAKYGFNRDEFLGKTISSLSSGEL